MKRSVAAYLMLMAVPLFMTACSSSDDSSTTTTTTTVTTAATTTPGSAAATSEPAPGNATTPQAGSPTPAGSGSWDQQGKPVSGGPAGADGSTGNNLTQDYCAHNQDPGCPQGSYVGPYTTMNDSHGAWDGNGNPVKGGPTGADGSTGNGLTQEYCAHNQDPGCPAGSYVAPNAIQDPAGGPGYVTCEGTICTNPNHGAGDEAPGIWDSNGNPINGGPAGADGSTGNNLSAEYCDGNEDPGCPVGSHDQG